MRYLTLMVLTLSSFSALAAPEQFKSVAELMDSYQDFKDYKDYPAFKVLSEKPLHIQVSPPVLEKSSAEQIKVDIEKASVYAVYRSLYQTPATSIKVTVIPLSMNLDTHEMKYLDAERIDFTATKKQAVSLAKQYGNINNEEDVITASGDWAPKFQSCCYLESGKPGVAVFSKHLINHK